MVQSQTQTVFLTINPSMWDSNQSAAGLLTLGRDICQKKIICSNGPLIRQSCAQISLWSHSSALEFVIVRHKCARIRVGSDFPGQCDLWSDHLQTMIQTTVCLNCRSDPIIPYGNTRMCAWVRLIRGQFGSGPQPGFLWAELKPFKSCFITNKGDWSSFHGSTISFS